MVSNLVCIGCGNNNNIFLKNDINQLQNDERKLNYNIKKNKQDFEIIKKQYENTISEFKLNELVQQTKIQKLQDDILFNDKLLNDSKNKNLKLEKENSELKKQLSNVQHLNIYKEELIANRFHPKNFPKFNDWGYL